MKNLHGYHHISLEHYPTWGVTITTTPRVVSFNGAIDLPLTMQYTLMGQDVKNYNLFYQLGDLSSGWPENSGRHVNEHFF